MTKSSIASACDRWIIQATAGLFVLISGAFITIASPVYADPPTGGTAVSCHPASGEAQSAATWGAFVIGVTGPSDTKSVLLQSRLGAELANLLGTDPWRSQSVVVLRCASPGLDAAKSELNFPSAVALGTPLIHRFGVDLLLHVQLAKTEEYFEVTMIDRRVTLGLNLEGDRLLVPVTLSEKDVAVVAARALSGPTSRARKRLRKQRMIASWGILKPFADKPAAKDEPLRGQLLRAWGDTLYGPTLDGDSDSVSTARAIVAYASALDHTSRELFQDDWSATQNNRCGTLRKESEARHSRYFLDQAVLSCMHAVESASWSNHKLNWLSANNNLGLALGAVGRQTGDAKVLTKAVMTLQAGASAFPFGKSWETIRIQSDLGQAYLDLYALTGDATALRSANEIAVRLGVLDPTRARNLRARIDDR